MTFRSFPRQRRPCLGGMAKASTGIPRLQEPPALHIKLAPSLQERYRTPGASLWPPGRPRCFPVQDGVSDADPLHRFPRNLACGIAHTPPGLPRCGGPRSALVPSQRSGHHLKAYPSYLDIRRAVLPRPGVKPFAQLRRIVPNPPPVSPCPPSSRSNDVCPDGSIFASSLHSERRPTPRARRTRGMSCGNLGEHILGLIAQGGALHTEIAPVQGCHLSKLPRPIRWVVSDVPPIETFAHAGRTRTMPPACLCWLTASRPRRLSVLSTPGHSRLSPVCRTTTRASPTYGARTHVTRGRFKPSAARDDRVSVEIAVTPCPGAHRPMSPFLHRPLVYPTSTSRSMCGSTVVST